MITTLWYSSSSASSDVANPAEDFEDVSVGFGLIESRFFVANHGVEEDWSVADVSIWKCQQQH
jgi:hypothetical protein